MITKRQATTLKSLIVGYADTKEAASWSGASDPRDIESLKHEYEAARERLETFIRNITEEKS